MRILHTADWQIGKGFGRISGDAGALLREQRYTTVRRVAELASEHAVDAVLVAGDVFDSQTLPDATLRRTLEAMAAFTGAWVLLPGNHDAALAESVWTRMGRLGVLPANVHPALRPEPLLLAGDRLALLPAPLTRRHEPEDVTEWFDEASTPPGAVRIGLAHGSVTNRLPEGAATHNPIADDRSERARLDYLALGDWHGTLEIAPRTWYAGTPETDGFRSRDPGHVLLVDVPEPGVAPAVTPLETTHYRWFQRHMSIGGAADVDGLDAHLSALTDDPSRALLRLTIDGIVDLAARAALDEVFARWQARLHYLEVDDAGLHPRASDADLAAFEGSGFVADALAELRDRQRAGEPHAADAIQRLYAAYQQLHDR